MPAVSIIVPCYNEQATIRYLLEAVDAQTFTRSEMEVVVADGLSNDGTIGEIEAFQRDHPDLTVRVVVNQNRSIPAALNTAVRASKGKFIIRLDAHSIPAPDYVARCLDALNSGKGSNVGGVWNIRPGASGWMAQSIALAAGHPMGAGDALYRLGGSARQVDTVPFGAYERELIDRIGGYDESLLSNEDYEFNVRIRESGGVIWLDPAIRSIYFARADLLSLARQYWRYGFWKARMLRRYPTTLRWRQLLPPLFVLSLLILLVCSIIWTPVRWVLLATTGVYLIAMILAGLQVAWKYRLPVAAFGTPLALLTMHISWGSAFLWSWLRR